MAKVAPALDDRLRAFIAAQPLFFVATAPAALDGHVNCSPKGLDSFRVLGPTTVAYADLTGSGAETIAHLRENGRIVIMFCAFQDPPKILRLHGRGTVIAADDAAFAALAAQFAALPGVRAIVRVEVTRISESCGSGVPLLRYEGQRPQLPAWAERKGPAGLHDYQRANNARSIDGLPAVGE